MNIFFTFEEDDISSFSQGMSVYFRLYKTSLESEELNDIIRYGSKELFSDDNDESVKSGQIHYDDTAIDRLLNREQDGDEEASLDDEEGDGFLKAFKEAGVKLMPQVANFEYVDEAEVVAEEEEPAAQGDNKDSVNNFESASYWKDLLRDKYELHKIEELNAMGKRKRSRKQMVSVEQDDLACFDDVSSDGEDNTYESELADNDTALAGATTIRRPHRKRVCADTSEPLPLMEGQGRSLRVLGFNKYQRATFVQILMRFGLGDHDWAEFTPRLKQKTYEEIDEHCGLLYFLNMSYMLQKQLSRQYGVPKEGLRIVDVLVRITTLSLIRGKVNALSKEGSTLFADDILSRYPGLKGGRVWKEHHDQVLLRAALKHGYGRWQAIINDKDLRIQEVICQELNLPQRQKSTLETSLENQTKGTNGGNDQHHLKEMQRRQVEFIKKRMLLLEKGLAAELQKEYFDNEKKNDMPNEKAGLKATDAKNSSSKESSEMIDQLPQLGLISSEETMTFACDKESDRLDMARLYNEMSRITSENAQESVEAYIGSRPASLKLGAALETYSREINQILLPKCSNGGADTKMEEKDNNSKKSGPGVIFLD
ncbi:hypothetical protein BUALT_Bualt05G0000900 [Buddleja alternifolia]|uniref:Uncharacterized protein n=1 Tax=Buddleja alternifolia TaxID=168488 RepID=A0AAV6XN99_9LAMI|nr:hypothetical protein BUALT_Bualt05G0000900 [Buddleja alternifolia]